MNEAGAYEHNGKGRIVLAEIVDGDVESDEFGVGGFLELSTRMSTPMTRSRVVSPRILSKEVRSSPRRSESATPRTGSMSIPSDRVPVGSIRNVRRLHGQRDGCPTRRHRRRFPGLPFARSVRVAFSRSTRKECSIWSGSSRAGHSLTI